MADDTLETSVLIDDMRTRMATIAGVYVAPRIGDNLPAAKKHKGVRILGVDEDPVPLSGTFAYTIGTRTVTLEWFHGATSKRAPNGDADALDFADALLNVLVGQHDTWANARKLRPGPRSPAIERDGGHYTGQLTITCHRAIPTG